MNNSMGGHVSAISGGHVNAAPNSGHQNSTVTG